jgi:hypothetical protein
MSSVFNKALASSDRNFGGFRAMNNDPVTMPPGFGNPSPSPPKNAQDARY